MKPDHFSSWSDEGGENVGTVSYIETVPTFYIVPRSLKQNNNLLALQVNLCDLFEEANK